ncbi:Transcriptional regulatory protein DegU [bacterium HR23]|nr:Transcriptional regulatory protein DegU [bacterium HR23]
MESLGKRPVSILLVDDHPLFREGLKAVLSSAPDMTVVGEAGTGQEGVELARSLQPDVVLMDVRLPDMDGLEATTRVRKVAPTTRVVILTGFDDPEYLKRALLAGAAGYRLKGVSPESLLRDIRTIMDGGSIIDSALWPTLVQALSAAGPPLTPEERERFATLTPTEREVLRRMAQGLSNAQIAQELHYTEGTVKNIVGRIFDKLGVGDRAQAVYLATRGGII